MYALLHVEKDPHVRHGVQLELFDDELSLAGRGGPVNAAETIAGDVIAHARGVGRDVMRATAQRISTWQVPDRVRETLHLHGGRVDHDAARLRKAALELEQPQGIAAGDDDRAQSKATTPLTQRTCRPAVCLVRPQVVDHPAGVMVKQVRVIPDHHPQFRQPRGIAQRKVLLQWTAYLGTGGARGAAETQPLRSRPGP